MTRLLLDENVIVVQPALVRALGSMIDAAILQQLHYWMPRAKAEHAGHRWVYKTLDEWADEIGVTMKQAKSAVARLEAEGIVISCQPEGSNRRKWYRIEYDHVLFRSDRAGRSNSPDGTLEGTERAVPSAPQGRSYVTELTTETTTETTSNASTPAARLANLLADEIAANGSRRPSVTRAWVTVIDRMMRIDGRTEAEVEAAIRWAQSDDFWTANILSPEKLRKHYDRMRLQAGRSRSRPLAGVADYLSAIEG
jgi:hypothetical protein